MSDRMTFWLDDVRVFLHDGGRRGKLLDPRRNVDDVSINYIAFSALGKELDEGARALRLRLKVVVFPALDERDPRRSALIGIGKALSELRFATRLTWDDPRRVSKGRSRLGNKVLKDPCEHVAEVAIAFDRCRTVFGEAEHLFVTPENEFRRDGETWVLKYGDESARVKPSKGLAYIKELIEHPRKHIDATELIQRVGGMAATSEDDQIGEDDQGLEAATVGAALREDGLSVTVGGASLPRDSATEDAWRKALDQLQDGVDGAKASGDAEEITKAQSRLNVFKKERSRHYNYMGRERDYSDPREKARNAVSGAIGRAKNILEREIPLLGKHIRNSVKGSGAAFAYNPEHSVDWAL
jgi:hypothetical protein